MFDKDKFNRKLKIKYKQVLRFLVKHIYWVILILILLVFPIFFLKLGLVVLMVVLAVIVGLHRMVLPIYLGIELVTFFTVIISYTVNPFVGWLAALAMLLFNAGITGYINHFTFVKIGAYTIACLICWIFPVSMIFYVGMGVTIFVNLVYVMTGVVLKDVQTLFDLPGNAINIYLNWWLFSNLAQLLLSIGL